MNSQVPAWSSRVRALNCSNCESCTSSEMGLNPPSKIRVSRGWTVDPPVAKLAPWRKFVPMESKYALKYGNPNVSAARFADTPHNERLREKLTYQGDQAEPHNSVHKISNDIFNLGSSKMASKTVTIQPDSYGSNPKMSMTQQSLEHSTWEMECGYTYPTGNCREMQQDSLKPLSWLFLNKFL